MSLPARNLFLRGVYGLMIVAMFLFLFWQSWLPDTDKPEHVISQTVDIKPSQPNRDLSSGLLRQPRYLIAGLSRWIDLNADINQQVSDHWLAFSGSLAQQADYSQPIYAAYTEFDRNTNKVVLTLGYEASMGDGGNPAMDYVTVSAGIYRPYPNETVLDVWQKITQEEQGFIYKTDFERWQLDENFQPVAVTTYLGLK